MKKRSNIFLGLLFIFSAVIVTVSVVGFRNNINLLNLIITLGMFLIIATSVSKLNFLGIFMPIGVIAILYSKQLGIQGFTPFSIIIVTFLLGMGLSFIFPRHNKKLSDKEENFNEIIDEQDESDVRISAKFKGCIKYINTDELKRAYIGCSFGGMKIYFNNSKIKEEDAIINLNADFSGIELIIPKQWKVVDNIDYIFSGIEEKNEPETENDKRIILTGKARFSGVTIKYV